MIRRFRGFRTNIRAVSRLATFAGATLLAAPVQFVLLHTGSRWARTFPHWFHRQACRLIAVRVHTHGAVERPGPVLLLSNHISWLDILVLGAIAPVSFVAKREVGTWPLISWLARLQSTIFIDRERRSDVHQTAGVMLERLRSGDTIVLFPEGTSTDGLRVLPFRSSLLAPVKPGKRSGADRATGEAVQSDHEIQVQTCAIAYTHNKGLPIGRIGMPLIAWYGDMEIGSHAWAFLRSGPVDVHVAIGDPVPLDEFADRKELASRCEAEVRATMSILMRTGGTAAQPDLSARTPENNDLDATLAGQ